MNLMKDFPSATCEGSLKNGLRLSNSVGSIQGYALNARSWQMANDSTEVLPRERR
jgi:hypothetical protein